MMLIHRKNDVDLVVDKRLQDGGVHGPAACVPKDGRTLSLPILW